MIRPREFISAAQSGESQHSVRYYNASNMTRQVSELQLRIRHIHLHVADDILYKLSVLLLFSSAHDGGVTNVISLQGMLF